MSRNDCCNSAEKSSPWGIFEGSNGPKGRWAFISSGGRKLWVPQAVPFQAPQKEKDAAFRAESYTPRTEAADTNAGSFELQESQ